MWRWSGLVLCCLTTTVPAAEVYDLIPADAQAAVACRSIEGIVKKSEKLIKDLELKVPEQPANICRQVFNALGIQKGVDFKGGCSLVLVNQKHIGAAVGLRNLEEFLVAAIPFTDLDTMASNFGFDKGKLKPETVTTLQGMREFGKLGYARGKHLYLGANEKAILSVAKGKSLGEELNADRRKYLAEADCICQLGTQVWGDVWKEMVKGTEQYLERFMDETDRKTARELLQALSAVRQIVCTCKLDGGFGCGCMCLFPKDAEESVKKFVATLRGGDGGSSLKGLPTGNVVAAFGAKGDGSKNGHIMRVLFELLQQDILETNRIFGLSDRPAVLATFNDIWPRLQGSRFALFKTADERKLGLFSAVGIVDVDDPERFLAQLKLLAKLGSADGLDLTSEAGKEKTGAEIEALVKDLGNRRFQVRESATAKLLLAGEQVLPYVEKALQSKDLETARRAERIKKEIVQAAEARRKELLSGELTKAVKPSFVFLDKTEKLDGFEVHNIGVKLTKRDAATAPQFRQLLGPDWARVRLGVQGKQIVLLAGSDTKLLTEALANLKDGKAGLAGAATLGDQAKRIEPARKLEFHVSLAMARALATAADLAKPEKLPANPALTSIGLTIEEDRLQCECWLPLPELKVVIRAAELENP